MVAAYGREMPTIRLVRVEPRVAIIEPVVKVEFERIEVLELLGMTLAHLIDAETRADLSPRMPLLMAIRDKLCARSPGGNMSYSQDQVSAAIGAMEKYREGQEGEVGAALVVVGLSAERVSREARIRDDLIGVAHRAGASIRQLAEISGLGRKAVTAIVSPETRL